MRKLVLSLLTIGLLASCKKEEKENTQIQDNPGIYHISGTVNGTTYEIREGVSLRKVMDDANLEDAGGGNYDAQYTCGIYNFMNPYPYFQLWIEKNATSLNDANDLASAIEVGTDTIGSENSNGITWNFYYMKTESDFFLPSSSNPKINITEVLDLGNQTVDSGIRNIDNTTRRVIQVSGNIPPCTLTNFSSNVSLDTAFFTIRFVSNQTF
jgi:hypothetical protein